ncbi:MAG: hypothetical protein IT429_05840 [Gemmataceae bacterium]|nr:hypothetical protein [Gemmataceae bacterium]
MKTTMDENLLGYLLNALDPADHQAVEAQLEADPAARQRLEVLRRALEPLAADRAQPEPPAGLVVRTLGHVAEHACRRLPHAPAPVDRLAAPAVPFWRRADVLVAACLLVTALGLLFPWVLSVREPAHVVACQDNLRRFYGSLKSYSVMHHDNFPDVARAAAAPRNVAGLVAPILKESGTLNETVSVRCPANGSPQPCSWKLSDLQGMDPAQFRRHVNSLVSCYAYSLGHRGQGGVIGPRFERDKPNERLPLLADCPPADPTLGNSPNHGGRGQNVLFRDGHVAFCTTRDVGFQRDDIYLNRAGKVAAGLGWNDAVLGSSGASPTP